VEMFIEANAKEIDLLAIVDTGARNTLISPEYARAIGLDVDKGIRKEFTPAKGFPF
jgi:predicted aspartyl protease